MLHHRQDPPSPPPPPPQIERVLQDRAALRDEKRDVLERFRKAHATLRGKTVTRQGEH